MVPGAPTCGCCQSSRAGKRWGSWRVFCTSPVMRLAAHLLAACALLSGCAGTPEPVGKSSASLAIVPAADPPVSRIESTGPGRHDAAVVGTAGGAASAADLGHGAAQVVCASNAPLL